MENTSGKISFGFSKLTKKPSLIKTNLEKNETKPKVELIDSIEGSQVLFQGHDVDVQKEEKLIIPVSSDEHPIEKLMASRRIKKEVDKIKKELINTKINDVDETLEQRAAREIMEDLEKRENVSEAKVLELPIHPDELPLEGATESNIDDYERIPISDFGKAMLRGMGWKEEEEKEKIFDAPVVRPKGLGLGADKVVKKQPLLIAPAQNEVLEIKKNACIKILAGKHKNLYGTIEGFEGIGRLIVKLAIGSLKIIMNEFMVQPISKQEFAKYGKILNSVKYEKYMNAEEGGEKKSRSVSPRPTSSSSSSKNRDKSSENHHRRESRDLNGSTSRRDKDNRRERSKERRRSRERRRVSSDSEEDKTNNRKYNEKHRSRSHEKHHHRKRHSSSSDSDSDHHSSSRKKSNKKHSKSSKKYSSPSRYNSSDDERKHKRKYKRSKHHRDRS